MATLAFKSLSNWDGPRSDYPKWGQFKATYAETLEKLKDELDRLDAEAATLELDFSPHLISKRGAITPGAYPRSECVRLSFYHPEHGLLRYPCNAYSKWVHNLRAIALTLEAQRAITRYGAAQHGQQYTGWQQLPAGEGVPET